MANAIFKALLTFVVNVIGVFLAPIDLVVSTAFPSLSNLVNSWTNDFSIITDFISKVSGYILNLLPYTTRHALTIYLGVLLATYTVTLTIHLIVKVIKIIQNIKFW